jgi:hypothetical protein
MGVKYRSDSASPTLNNSDNGKLPRPVSKKARDACARLREFEPLTYRDQPIDQIWVFHLAE